jgi:hypothetical protein
MDERQVDMTGFAADSSAAPLVAGSVAEEYVDAIPLRGESGPGIISGALLCAVIYFTLLATVQLRGRGLLSGLVAYFTRGKSPGQLVAGNITPNVLLLFLSLCLSFFSFALLVVYLEGEGFVLAAAARYTCYFLAYHFALLGVVWLSGWVFNARDCAQEVALNAWVYNTVPGIALSPGAFALFEARAGIADALLVAMAFALVLYAIARLWRWVKILFERGVPIFYLILYLCALEILPLLVLYKVLAGDFRDV